MFLMGLSMKSLRVSVGRKKLGPSESSDTPFENEGGV